MIICHPDQMAKVREHETSGVMFPKGAHQLAAYCYAMEGVPAHEISVHQKMIMMRNAGEVEPFSGDGVNMSGSTTLEKRGECAILRQQIAEMNGGDDRYLRARFGSMSIEPTYASMEWIALRAHEVLTSGRRKSPLSKKYVADLVLCALRPSYRREVNCPQEIIRRHEIKERYFFRDMGSVKCWFRQNEEDFLSKISKKFGDGVVLACLSVS